VMISLCKPGRRDSKIKTLSGDTNPCADHLPSRPDAGRIGEKPREKKATLNVPEKRPSTLKVLQGRWMRGRDFRKSSGYHSEKGRGKKRVDLAP